MVVYLVMVFNVISDFIDLQVRFKTTVIKYLKIISEERQLTKKRRYDFREAPVDDMIQVKFKMAGIKY